MDQIQDILSDLEELLDERTEIQEQFDKATASGEAHEAYGLDWDLSELAQQIKDLKADLERLIVKL
jgi:seryl-tRNA synthetase